MAEEKITAEKGRSRRLPTASLSVLLVVVLVTGCGAADDTVNTPSGGASSASVGISNYTTTFTNEFGTPTTVCAHQGCTNFIADSGDTNCCTSHSNRCLECNRYIDEDAFFCMDCLEKASNSGAQASSSSETVYDWMKDQAVGKDYSKDDGGTYYCMGKNDTCPNTTRNAYDLYCDQCDPDGNNIEGRQ